MCKLGMVLVSQERLKLEVKSLLSANRKSYILRRLAQQWMTLSDLGSACLRVSVRFLSHSIRWALLAGDLRWHGFKSRSRHEFSVGWTNGRQAMKINFSDRYRGSACVLSKL